jgi:hypothetical protein
MTEQQDVFSISDKIKELIELEIKNVNDNEDNKLNGDDDKLIEYLANLHEIAKRIETKFIKGIGEMNDGILIRPNKDNKRDIGGLVFRNGKVYRYKKQYELDFKQIAESFLRYKDSIMTIMESDKTKIIYEVIDKVFKNINNYMSHVNSDERYGYALETNLIIDEKIAEGEVKIEPSNIFDFELDNYEDMSALAITGKMLKICKIRFNRGNIGFRDEFDNRLDNDRIHNICMIKYKKDIDEIRNNVILEMEKEKKRLEEIEEFINNKMGKYVLVAGL